MQTERISEAGGQGEAAEKSREGAQIFFAFTHEFSIPEMNGEKPL
jgi:hypothetical protein